MSMGGLTEKAGNIVFSEKNEPGATGNAGRYRSKPIPYGSATLESDPPDDLDALLDILTCSIAKFREAGADDITLHCDVFYSGQCNFEFSVNQIACLSKLKIPITISCYDNASSDSIP
jgi:hypothetical protein